MNCPRCHKTVELKKDMTSMVKCPRCNREFINEEIDEAFGVKRVDAIKGGVEVISFETIGDMCEKYPSWYCLRYFDTCEEKEEHDKKYHKIGDFMVGCIPSGFPDGYKRECGN